MKLHPSTFLTIGIMLITLSILYFFKSLTPEKANIFWQNIIDNIFSVGIKKSTLVDYYGVDKSTFRKWIKYFCPDIFPDFEKYKSKKKITLAQCISILGVLGMKEANPILYKKDIVKLGEGNYRSLRESVYLAPERFGITKEQFTNLRIFPPKISQKILEQYGC